MSHVDEYGYLVEDEEPDEEIVIIKADGSDAMDLLTRAAHCHTATGRCVKDRYGKCEPTPIANAVGVTMQLQFINPNYPLTSVVNKDAVANDPEVAPLLAPRERQDWSEDTFADQLARGEHQ